MFYCNMVDADVKTPADRWVSLEKRYILSTLTGSLDYTPSDVCRFKVKIREKLHLTVHYQMAEEF